MTWYIFLESDRPVNSTGERIVVMRYPEPHIVLPFIKLYYYIRLRINVYLFLSFLHEPS